MSLKCCKNPVLDLNYIDSSCKYQVIPLADAKADLKKYHTVICSSPETYWEIKKDLESLGLVEFDDFEYYTIYRKKSLFAMVIAMLMASKPY